MIAPQYYQVFYLYLIVVLTIFSAAAVCGKAFQLVSKGQKNGFLALLLCVFLSLWIGLRPSTNFYRFFADSTFYAHTFNLIKDGVITVVVGQGEWLWQLFTLFCGQYFDITVYFTIIAAGYFGFSYIACRILAKNNILYMYLFFLGAFSTYTYSVNGLRNGFACSIILMAIAVVAKYPTIRASIFGILLSVIAANVHRTTLLPIVCLFSSVFFVKSFRWAYTFWLLSILISLIGGNLIIDLFVSFGFDDDRISYLTSFDEGQFSHSGFRWDFLIYSMMPILLGYYVVIKKGIQDRTYLILLNTYTLANAFWVMVIRANYSNRFAYLSWFMYAIVLAYPLLRLNVWGHKQGSMACKIMLAHIGFTWFMDTFYW